MYLISGCLLGNNCKYSGGNNYNEDVVEFCKSHSYVPVCPEGISGLPTPRPPAEIVCGKVIDKNGKDVTEAFERGAKLSFEQAIYASKEAGEIIEGAILKANSPSCGSGQIYDGTFGNVLIQGDGYFAKLLKENGIKVITDKEINNGKF
ncbi:MAG: DUF523 domain-containing protein [Anaerovoracaceae bacterium]